MRFRVHLRMQLLGLGRELAPGKIIAEETIFVSGMPSSATFDHIKDHFGAIGIIAVSVFHLSFSPSPSPSHFSVFYGRVYRCGR